MFLYTTMGMGWEQEYGHANGRGMGSKKSFPHFSNGHHTGFIKVRVSMDRICDKMTSV